MQLQGRPSAAGLGERPAQRAAARVCPLATVQGRHGVQRAAVPAAGAPSSASAPRRRCSLARAVSTPAEAASSSVGQPGDGLRGAHWQVHKFGGTCMANADRIRAAAELMAASVGPTASTCVVVSAMGNAPSSPLKVTDLILNMIKKASRQDAAFLVDLASLQEKHIETAKQLLGQSPELTSFVASLMDDITNLKAMLQAMSIGARSLLLTLMQAPASALIMPHTRCAAGMSTDAFSDFVVGHGELWSGRLFALCCKQVRGFGLT
jgi:aspartokinase/homoserine dehydrogenase 1